MKSLLKLLLPPVSYGTDAPVLDAELQAEADQLTKAQKQAERVRNGVTPFFRMRYWLTGNGFWD